MKNNRGKPTQKKQKENERRKPTPKKQNEKQ